MLFKKHFLFAATAVLLFAGSCTKSTITDNDSNSPESMRTAALVASKQMVPDLKIVPASMPCLVTAPIQQQYPAFARDVYPAVTAVGIPMNTITEDEFSIAKADDSDVPEDDSYDRSFDASNLSPQTQNVLNTLNKNLDAIGSNPDIMDSDDKEPFLSATEAAFTKAESAAMRITDLKSEDLTSTVACIRGAKAKIRPTYAHYEKQACNFEEVNPAAEGKFWKKLGRAVLRVVAAVVVTAVVVAVVVVAAKLIAGATAVVALKAAGTALVKGLLLKGKIKVTAALASGAASGIKNASKNWDKPWKGAQEFIFGIKAKW